MIKKVIIANLIMMIALCTGCGVDGYERPEVSTFIDTTPPETAEVSSKDVDVSIHINLIADSSGNVVYHADHSDMEVENVYFEVGDVVHAGDRLVDFKSDEIENQIRNAEQRMEEDTILFEHIERLKRLYPSRDYTADSARVLNDFELAQAKKEEYSAWLDAYTIKAVDDGVVNAVSSIWKQSKVGPTDSLISVNYASGKFSGYTTEDCDFTVGAEYDVTVGVAHRKAILDAVEESGENDRGKRQRRIYVHLTDSDPTDEYFIDLTIPKPILKDVIYVTKDSVVEINNAYYVYVVDENDVPKVRKIKAFEGPDDIMIVESGLSRGERVVTSLR